MALHRVIRVCKVMRTLHDQKMWSMSPFVYHISNKWEKLETYDVGLVVFPTESKDHKTRLLVPGTDRDFICAI